jgi:hypothetical protein
MEQARANNAIPISQRSDELMKRIRKLRWIGLEEEARQLQLAMRYLSPEHIVTVPSESFGTD